MWYTIAFLVLEIFELNCAVTCAIDEHVGNTLFIRKKSNKKIIIRDVKASSSRVQVNIIISGIHFSGVFRRFF